MGNFLYLNIFCMINLSTTSLTDIILCIIVSANLGITSGTQVISAYWFLKKATWITRERWILSNKIFYKDNLKCVIEVVILQFPVNNNFVMNREGKKAKTFCNDCTYNQEKRTQKSLCSYIVENISPQVSIL